MLMYARDDVATATDWRELPAAVHVDTAVENGGQYADDAVINLTSTPATASGTGYVNSISLGL